MNHVQNLHAREMQILRSLEMQFLHTGALNAKISFRPAGKDCVQARMQNLPTAQKENIARRQCGLPFSYINCV
jgi:hypothetical protein